MKQDKYKKNLYCERNPNSNSDNYKTQYETIKNSKWNNTQKNGLLLEWAN